MAAANDSANAPTPLEREQIFGMAEKEMEYRVELFNKLTHTCFNKCVEKRYKESELNMGENSCIDRCVSKYWHVCKCMKGMEMLMHIKGPLPSSTELKKVLCVHQCPSTSAHLKFVGHSS